MGKKKIHGVIPPPIVPFTEDGEVDEKKLRTYINWLVEKGIHSLYCLGGFSSGPLMNMEERRRCAEIIVETAEGRIPIICHIGAQNTRDSATLAKHAEKIGMDAVASVPPTYYKHVPETIKAYYKELLDAVSIPLLATNFPRVAGYEIQLDLLVELAEMGLCGIKDTSQNLVYLTRAMDSVKKPDFIWISGTVPYMFAAVMMGADACVAGTANYFPEFTVSLWNAIQAKEFEKAAELQKKVTRLVSLQNITIDVVGAHEILWMRDLDFGYPRPPLKPLTETQRAKLKKGLMGLGLL
jgi:N-acetylneuraminate lyase/4-hydroxy-tetrahydrodipicolinate synthase